MDADTWASLPTDLLVEVLRRLAATAVVRCAGACRPWRRAVIANASSLRPRSDRFNPNLLIGFFYRQCSSSIVRLQYVPGMLEDVSAMDNAAADTPISSFIPLSAAGDVDIAKYDKPLSSHNGFLLLGGGRESKVKDLCLCNPLDGTCRLIPAAASGAHVTWTYVLVTDDDSAAVWVLAVRQEEDVKRGVIYQIFSPASGQWGPLKRSAKFEEGVARADMTVAGVHNDMVVCQGSVYCLVRLFGHRWPRRAPKRCLFAINMRTEHTWTMELTEDIWKSNRIILATAEDDRLSLIFQQERDHMIELWVLVGDGEWTLRRAIDMHSLIPDCPKEGRFWFVIRGFCPKSGCLFGNFGQEDLLIDINMVLFGNFDLKDLLIDINTGSLRRTGRFTIDHESKYPYEMDWSMYLSKMKYS
ncbi:unnamed protein product [Urochloa humidicola]